MTRWMAHAMIVTLFALIGASLANPDAGGPGSGTVSSSAELAARLAQIADTQAERRVASELRSLYAAIESFRDVTLAVEAGYGPATRCMVSDRGSQGIHYANDALFGTELVAETPQLLMYEPRPDGTLQLVGVEYLVFQAAWHAAGFEERPSLFGQSFAANDLVLDEPVYLLHVWIVQFNPAGLFADWNPVVDCSFDDAAAPPTLHGGRARAVAN